MGEKGRIGAYVRRGSVGSRNRKPKMRSFATDIWHCLNFLIRSPGLLKAFFLYI